MPKKKGKSPPELPEEVLRIIFSHLDGNTLVRCRRVCRSWLTAVDAMPDCDWKAVCSRDHEEYNHYRYSRDYGCMSEQFARVRAKYGLSWRDTYRALRSWKTIASSEMTSHKLYEGDSQYFKVLPNGIVAIPFNEREIEKYYTDTLVYYNIDTLEQCHQENLDFAFCQYDENEQLIVLETKPDNNLCVIVKETKQKYVVGSMNSNELDPIEQFTLIGNKLYFKDSKKNIICVSELKKENDSSVIVTEKLSDLPDGPLNEPNLAFNKYGMTFATKNNEVYMLIDFRVCCTMFVYKNSRFECVDEFFYNDDVFFYLQEYGFDWKSKPLFDWIILSFGELEVPAFYSHGMTYLSTSLNGRSLQIHYNSPCKENIFGMSDFKTIFTNNPLKKIFVKDLLDSKYGEYVYQLDVIETSTEHIILLGLSRSLLVVKLSIASKESRMPKPHKIKKKIVHRKKNTGTKKNSQNTMSKRKSKKNAVEVLRQINHGYATRYQMKERSAFFW